MSSELPTPWSVKEKLWSMARTAVTHEDGLVNQRLTWLISSHWFLIGGFAAIQAGLFAGKDKTPWMMIVVVESFLVVLFLFAIWLCTVVASSVESAFEHLRHIKEWWYSIYPEERLPARLQVVVSAFPKPSKMDCPLPEGHATKDFPPIMGDFGFMPCAGTSRIPFVFLYLDLVIIVFSAMCGVLYTVDLVRTSHLWVQALIPSVVATIGAGALVYFYRRIGSIWWWRWILFTVFFLISWSIVAGLIWYVTQTHTP